VGFLFRGGDNGASKEVIGENNLLAPLQFYINRFDYLRLYEKYQTVFWGRRRHRYYKNGSILSARAALEQSAFRKA
jgi:hypothetical protein